MLIKLKTLSEAVKQERIRLKIERGYSDSTLRTIRKEALLEYIPFEYFGQEIPVNKTFTHEGYTWYYIGNENWGVNSRFVEYVIENGEKKDV